MRFSLRTLSLWTGRVRSSIRTIAPFLFLGTLSCILHLLPFLRSSHPLGYDTGFYRRYLTEPFVSFPNTPAPGLGDDAVGTRLVLDLLRLLHLPTDIILYGSYILFFGSLPILLFLLMRPKLGARGAFIAGLLLISSTVLYEAYWYMLFKNAWALCLILLAFVGFERRWGAWLFLLDIAIAASHKTSAVIYILTLATLFIIARGRRRELFLHVALATSIVAALNLGSIREATVALPTATFLEWPQYLVFALPLLLLSACALLFMRTERPPLIWFAFAVASFFFPLLRLPFYERMFVFCDVALAGFAAYGAEYLVRNVMNEAAPAMKKYGSLAILCVTGGLMLGNLCNQARTLQPLVSKSDLQTISRIGMAVPPDATLLTTSVEAPWYEGWTQAHVAAPGLLHDRHNLESWTILWNATSTADKIAFLSSFPQPLYVSTLGDITELVGQPPACLEPVEDHLLHDVCPER